MDYECVQSGPSEWHVEAVDYENEGVVYVSIFSGPKAKERAEEYVALALGQGKNDVALRGKVLEEAAAIVRKHAYLVYGEYAAHVELMACENEILALKEITTKEVDLE